MLFDRPKDDNRGFSIIELTVSAGIIVVISALVVANFKGAGQRSALNNETERLTSIIRQAHINSLIGLTVDGVRPEGGYGVHFSECGLQQDACLDYYTPCIEYECISQGCMEYECLEYECLTQECVEYECAEYECDQYECLDYPCIEYECLEYECLEYECQSYDMVCSSGNVQGISACFLPAFWGGCSGDLDFSNGCCCGGTWEQGDCESYSSTCATFGSNCATPGPNCETYSPDCGTYGTSCEIFSSTCKTYGQTCATYGPGCDQYGPTCINEGPNCLTLGSNCITWNPDCDEFGPNCEVYGDPVCTSYGEEDIGDCTYTLFADQDADYQYNSGTSDSLIQEYGLLDANVYIDDISPFSSLDISFVPPYGDIYFYGEQAVDEVTIIVGYERTEYKKTIVIDRNTGKIDVQ